MIKYLLMFIVGALFGITLMACLAMSGEEDDKKPETGQTHIDDIE